MHIWTTCTKLWHVERSRLQPPYHAALTLPVAAVKRYDNWIRLEISHASTGRSKAWTHDIGAAQNKLDCTFVDLHTRQHEWICTKQTQTVTYLHTDTLFLHRNFHKHSFSIFCNRIEGQGQGHEPFKVWIPSIFKTYLLRHLQWELASDH